MEDPTAQKIRDVKRLLRAAMSGPVSASMRAQGLSYKLNFGVDQPRLLTIADEIRNDILGSDLQAPATVPEAQATVPEASASGSQGSQGSQAATLAAALWKEDIRECRILACMLMPTDAFDETLAEVWIEQLRFAEEAQALAMHLLERTPFASDIAFRLVSRDGALERLTGWLLFGRLFSHGHAPSQRDADEILDHALAELRDTASDLQLRQTVLNAINRYSTLGDGEEARANRILDSLWEN